MKKQLILMTMAMLPMLASAYDAKIGKVFYNLDSSNKTATVTYEYAMEFSTAGDLMYYNNCSGDIVIPNTVTYGGITYDVTSIEDYAFLNAGEMTSLTIPSSVKAIGKWVISDCNKLVSIVVENDNAFYDSRGGCNAIIRKSDNVLIYGCMNSTIPEGVKGIGPNAFFDCYNLTNIVIPNSVTTIYEDAFCQSGLTSVIMGNGLINIGDRAFMNCSNITTITIPNSVTTIGVNAFAYCESMTTSIVLGNSVSTIGDGAFYGCSKITSMSCPCNGILIGNNAFYGCCGMTSATIGNNLASISDPVNISRIGDNAFYECSGLTSVTIGNNVTSIGDYAFNGCRGLTSITIPDNVSNIGILAFFGCTGLTSVTLGYNLKSIGEHAFASSSNLQTAYCYAPVPPSYSGDVFGWMNKELMTLYVPSSSISDYQNYYGEGYETKGWDFFTTILPIATPGTGKLTTPTITLTNGVLKFDCGTDDVEYHYSITYPESNNNTIGNNIQMPQSFTVSVYAIKAGFEKSDTATKQFTIVNGLKGDLTGDGKVDVADHVELSKIIMGK